jgi:hypothetical protein
MSWKGNDKYFFSKEAIEVLIEETKELSESKKTRVVTEWIEDNCEVEDDLNYMVKDLMNKMKGL